jgi:hypothetical protein
MTMTIQEIAERVYVSDRAAARRIQPGVCPQGLIWAVRRLVKSNLLAYRLEDAQRMLRSAPSANYQLWVQAVEHQGIIVPTNFIHLVRAIEAACIGHMYQMAQNQPAMA